MIAQIPLIPYLRDTEDSKQLVVNGRPFLMLAAELNNSSMSCPNYMKPIWPELRDLKINTVLGNVTWEMAEPQEGQFNFKELDAAVYAARDHGLKLVILWFGAFKNGMSSYAPSWVKSNNKRFPRAKTRNTNGTLGTANVFSLFHNEAREADARAFAAMMRHLKELDESHNTVIMVQVENEPGLLGDSRDRCEAAEKAFTEDVPEEVVKFFRDEWEQLHPLLQENLAGFRTCTEKVYNKSKSWGSILGKGRKTNEIFMAYYYAKYLDAVAAAGKCAYPIPCFVNAWQNRIDAETPDGTPVVAAGGGEPGVYPSGGPTVNVLDIWQKFASHVDFIAPDIYLNDYGKVCRNYRHRNQPLFIPEQRRDEYGARRIWTAIGAHKALGVSPFGIDTIDFDDKIWPRHYGLLSSVSSIILEAQRDPDTCVGFHFDEIAEKGEVEKYHATIKHWDDLELSIERCFVFGKAGPGAGMVIRRGNGRFLLLGWGFQVVARSLDPRVVYTGILSFEEKTVDSLNGNLTTSRWLNGDESRSGSRAMMPNLDPDYGTIPISSTIPARTAIAEVVFYTINDESDLENDC